MQLKSLIRNVPDFPKPGIMFRDITPLLGDAAGYKAVIDDFARRYSRAQLDVIIGIESRGFLFASTLAYALKLPLALIRKPGKLPHPKMSYNYELEYGNDTVELNNAAIAQGHRVLIIDDLLATGGTALAACMLIEQMGGEVHEIATVIELAYIKGRERLAGYSVYSQVVYDNE